MEKLILPLTLMRREVYNQRTSTMIQAMALWQILSMGCTTTILQVTCTTQPMVITTITLRIFTPTIRQPRPILWVTANNTGQLFTARYMSLQFTARSTRRNKRKRPKKKKPTTISRLEPQFPLPTIPLLLRLQMETSALIALTVVATAAPRTSP